MGRSWIPVPGTPKGRLVAAALAEFGAHGHDAVAVGDLVERAGVTTGALYHHFGSKLGLYALVRGDVEQRVIDRMEGAAAIAVDLGAPLLVGYDYVVRQGFVGLLGEPHPEGGDDPIAAFLSARADPDGVPVGLLLAAAWRAALTASRDHPAAARAALSAVVSAVPVR